MNCFKLASLMKPLNVTVKPLPSCEFVCSVCVVVCVCVVVFMYALNNFVTQHMCVCCTSVVYFAVVLMVPKGI